jgi:hypothetical protein
MFGTKEKSSIENLFDAYKIGEMPLTLVVLGAIVMLLPFGEGLLEKVLRSEKAIIDPRTSLIVGGGIVVVGAIVWSISVHQRIRSQIAVLTFLHNAAIEAAKFAKDGANFKVALEDITESLPRLMSATVTPDTAPTVKS